VKASGYENGIVKFHTEKGYLSKILVLQGMGLVSIGESEKQVNTELDVFEDKMKIAWFSGFLEGHISWNHSKSVLLIRGKQRITGVKFPDKC
jgi:hypothetical protein